MHSYYDLLGVDADASTDEIEAAYRERLKDVHPDVSDDADASDRTKALIEARDVLTDADERARYDQLGHDQFCRLNDTVVDPRSTADHASTETDDETDTGRTDSGSSSRTATRSRPGDGSSNETSTANGARSAGGSAWNTGTAGAAAGTTAGAGASASTSTGTGASTATSGAGTGAATNSDRSSWGSWRTWDTDDSYNVRREDERVRGNRLFPIGPSLIVLGTAFLVYPVLLGATLLPAFPLVVNVVVGLCVLFLVIFLQSMPSVGVVVFGAWTVLLPVLMLALGIEVFSLVGLAAMTGTVLPLGLSTLTWVALRA